MDSVDAPTPQHDERRATVRLAPGVFVRAEDLVFTATRASGPGGQHVNKVSTRIELRVRLGAIGLRPAALERLRALAGRRVSGTDELVLSESGSRSQSANREAVLERLRVLVARALVEPKRRVATKPTKGSQRRRVEGKQRQGERKRLRRRPADD